MIKRITAMIMLIAYVVVSGLPFLDVDTASAKESYTVDDWAKWDIRTKQTDEVTSKAMDKLLEKNGYKNGAMYGLGDAIIEAGEVNAINPAFLFAQMVMESGWGTSKRSKTHNNLGGIKCMSDADEEWGGCASDGFQKFPDTTTFVQAHAELLRAGYIEGRKIYTIKDILEVYAPESDNNNHQEYIATLQDVLEALGQTPVNGEPLKASDSATYKVNGGTVGEYAKNSSLFLETTGAYKSGIGKDSSNSVMFSTEMAYRLMGWSEDAYKIMIKVGVAIGAVLLGYISLTVLLYVALIKGYSNDTKWFEKLSKIEGDVYERKTLVKLILRMLIVIIIIALCFSGFYVNLMAIIYQAILKIVGIFY